MAWHHGCVLLPASTYALPVHTANPQLISAWRWFFSPNALQNVRPRGLLLPRPMCPIHLTDRPQLLIRSYRYLDPNTRVVNAPSREVLLNAGNVSRVCVLLPALRLPLAVTWLACRQQGC